MGWGEAGSRELEKRQNSVYNNWTWHQEKDSAVAELVRDYAQVKARFEEPANIFEIQEELTKIREDLAHQLDYQLASDNNLPEAVRAEAMGEPLKTIEELIGE